MSDSKKKIGIIKFASTNLFSIQNALSNMGNVKIITNVNKFRNIDILVLPGVGTFSGAMSFLRKKKLDKKITEYAKSGKAIIGVCLGMQILLEKGFETKKTKGLSLIKGNVIKFKKKSPNIGWSKIKFFKNKVKKNNNFFYFVHSNYCNVDTSSLKAISEFNGQVFPAIIQKKNIIGIQFHPEKSGFEGVKLLKKIVKKL